MPMFFDNETEETIMNRTHVLAPLLGALALFTSGCEGCGGVIPVAAPPDYCRDQDDCTENQTCIEHRCVDNGVTICTGDGDCPSGQVCLHNICGDPQPEGGSCYEDADCQAGLVCLDGVCAQRQPEGGGCLDDGDCQEGLVCENSVCTAPPTGCTTDDDCDPRLVCWQNQCLADPDDGNDDTCADGEVTICHVPPGDPDGAHAVCVGFSAARVHLSHGDLAGQCPTDGTTDGGVGDGGVGDGGVDDDDDPPVDGQESCPEYKAMVCHIPPGNPADAHGICVGNRAVQAHVAHGDLAGPCPQ